jgi:hypothetical protein
MKRAAKSGSDCSKVVVCPAGFATYFAVKK